jgi:GH24 family phage-related lysozyme (muramidase)
MINGVGDGLRVGSGFWVRGINFGSIEISTSDIGFVSDKVNFSALNVKGVLGSLIGGILRELLTQTLSNQISPFSLSSFFGNSCFNQLPNAFMFFNSFNNQLIMVLFINLLMILLQQRNQQANGFLTGNISGRDILGGGSINSDFSNGMLRSFNFGEIMPTVGRSFGMPYVGSLISNSVGVNGVGGFGSGEYSVDLIKKFEGFSPKAYWDYDHYSIGYGTRANSPDEVITEQEAEIRLRKHVEQYVIPGIKNIIGQERWNQLSYNQKSALVSFVYNLGLGQAEPVLILVKKGKIKEAAQKMKKYVYAGGEVLESLVYRRNEEAKLLLS